MGGVWNICQTVGKHFEAHVPPASLGYTNADWSTSLRFLKKKRKKGKKSKRTFFPFFIFIVFLSLKRKLKILQLSLSLSLKARAFSDAVVWCTKSAWVLQIWHPTHSSSPFIWLGSLLFDSLDQRCRWQLQLYTFSTSVAMFSSIASIATMSGIYFISPSPTFILGMLNLMGYVEFDGLYWKNNFVQF